MIFLGKIVKTRGNKGEVVVHSSPSFEAYAPEKGEVVVLQSHKYEVQSNIDYIKEIQGVIVIKFQSVNSIPEAMKYIGYSIFSLAEPKENIDDEPVIDFSVIDISGQLWGNVHSHEFFGINEVLEILDHSGDIIYIPFSEAIIKKIDYEKKEIIIDPPDGLKDLNKS